VVRALWAPIPPRDPLDSSADTPRSSYVHDWKEGFMPRSVMTGVAGFIGSHLAEHPVALGHEVVGSDARIAGYIADPLSSHPRLRQRASA
jgi:hypothetical protein